MKDIIEWQEVCDSELVKFVPMSIEVPVRYCTHSEEDVLALVGEIAGECYNSARDIESCKRRALGCIKRGHHSPWEHVNVTLKCTVDRGTSHALVRHRHCAFQQSSTIYQNYAKDSHITITKLPLKDPCTGEPVPLMDAAEYNSYILIAQEYMQLVSNGMNPARARDVLPNSLATTLIITTNIREWQYIIQRRNGAGDAVRMHMFDYMLHNWFKEHYPIITEAFRLWYEEHPL